jgi:hypothetical protein
LTCFFRHVSQDFQFFNTARITELYEREHAHNEHMRALEQKKALLKQQARYHCPSCCLSALSSPPLMSMLEQKKTLLKQQVRDHRASCCLPALSPRIAEEAAQAAGVRSLPAPQEITNTFHPSVLSSPPLIKSTTTIARLQQCPMEHEKTLLKQQVGHYLPLDLQCCFGPSPQVQPSSHAHARCRAEDDAAEVAGSIPAPVCRLPQSSWSITQH